MRIIAGRLGGRQFSSPRGHRTHPMSDKTRGALFNALGDVEGLTVLDAFAGSGALSFEALSRGAAQATAIDRDRNAQLCIEENTKELNLKNNLKLIKAPAASWLATTTEKFDLVFLDPPFDDLQTQLTIRLAARTKTNGVVVFSLPSKAEIKPESNYKLLTSKLFGDNKLVFYRRIS